MGCLSYSLTSRLIGIQSHGRLMFQLMFRLVTHCMCGSGPIDDNGAEKFLLSGDTVAVISQHEALLMLLFDADVNIPTVLLVI